MVPVPNHDVTKNLTGHRMHVDGSQISEMNLTTIAFRKLEHALGKNCPFGHENLFRPKNTSRWPIVHESGLPDFGRLWTPNP